MWHWSEARILFNMLFCEKFNFAQAQRRKQNNIASRWKCKIQQNVIEAVEHECVQSTKK